MPLWLDYLCATLGILSFIMTVLTLINTFRLKKAVIETKERQHLKLEFSNLVHKIEGFMQSLESNQADEALYQSIDCLATDLLSNYSFLSPQAKETIGKLKQYYKQSTRDAHEYHCTLIELKNSINKEVN